MYLDIYNRYSIGRLSILRQREYRLTGLSKFFQPKSVNVRSGSVLFREMSDMATKMQQSHNRII